ncbi:MAG: hypothetical protein IIC26_05820 [Chloroflexi bacterium]|nr:hypothetical protein [Chloroflexota bacterium]
MERETLSWRQLPGVVNLTDFSHMVSTELRMLAMSLRLAPESLPRLPFGPLIFLAGMLVAMLRFAVLVLVVVVFGPAILAITVVRGVAGLARRRPAGG